MNTSSQPPERRDRMLREKVHDTYKLGGKIQEPARCPQCGAFYRKGRWTWALPPEGELREHTCSACHRISDDYPAGEVTLKGRFVLEHKRDILGLARNLEATENAEHPLNRIMEIRELPDRLLLKTTDVHLPRRIGKALEDAWEGELQIHFDEEGYFTRVVWERDA
jgi:hypothetical protein